MDIFVENTNYHELRIIYSASFDRIFSANDSKYSVIQSETNNESIELLLKVKKNRSQCVNLILRKRLHNRLDNYIIIRTTSRFQ